MQRLELWRTPTTCGFGDLMIAEHEFASIECHDGDEPADCQQGWCCGCSEHPAGKPWGWNFAAWDRHFREAGHAVIAS